MSKSQPVFYPTDSPNECSLLTYETTIELCVFVQKLCHTATYLFPCCFCLATHLRHNFPFSMVTEKYLIEEFL